MSQDVDARSPLVRFIDSFLQERNIKWMLGIGLLILFGSSVMLVTSRWESYAPVWKHLILLGYTAAVYGIAEVCYWRLGLRRTGTVLQALSVLLVPIDFLALYRVWEAVSSKPIELVAPGVLLGLTCVGGWIVARRVFSHFLRGNQRTFVASYLILSAAGAVVPSLPHSWSPLVALLLWVVFTLGTVKVNRHVFWLTEEHRLPRVFGFFPIALLGTQFLILTYTTGLVQHVPFDWMGLGLVLVSVPILLTADTVARVFQDRTGNLVRPLPWIIVLPTVVGLALCAGGVCLAGAGLPRPFALVPTAALAAGMMAVAARRTGREGFVWAMLVGILLAYNFSPLFYQELARSFVQQGALAVQEERLPYAFYGLTYLPLLCVTTIAGALAARRKNLLFARPLQLFSVGVASLLLGAAFGHAKAIFPVAAVMTPMFVAQTLAFRDRRLMGGAVISFATAAFGFTHYAIEVLHISVLVDMTQVCLAAAAALLLFPGRKFDEFCESRFDSSPVLGDALSRARFPTSICQRGSLVVTILAAAAWVAQYGILWGQPLPILAGALLSGLLVIHAFMWLRSGLGEVAICFAGFNGLAQLAAQDASLTTITSAATISLLVCWLASYALEKKPLLRISRAFGLPLFHVTLLGLSVLLVGYLGGFTAATLGEGVDLPWLCAGLAILWAFDAAIRTNRSFFTVLGCAGVLGFESALLAALTSPETSWEWLPALWAATATVSVPIVSRLRALLPETSDEESASPAILRIAHLRAITQPMTVISVAILALAGVASLASFLVASRVAGGIAIVGLFLFARVHRSPKLAQLTRTLLNAQLLSAVVQIFAPELRSIAELNWVNAAPCCLPVAFCAGLSLLWIEIKRTRTSIVATGPSPAPTDAFDFFDECDAVRRSLLRVLIGLAFVDSLVLFSVGLTTFQISMAALAFVSIGAAELVAACRTIDARRVWSAQATVLAALGYFALFGVIRLGSPYSMFAVLAAGFVMWTLGQLAGRHPNTSVLSAPLSTTAIGLPLLAVGLGVYRHVAYLPGDWLGMNSLALLFAAAFYFWLGIERSQNRWFVLSTGIVNIALALLWGELSWSDPQFFMIPLGASILMLVQVLKREIPAPMRTPLTYLGALTILISPTFHIVGGSWLPLLMLMIVSVAVTLVSIGLRVRALMYTGTAFLVADLVAMVVRGGVDYPNLLWVGGIALGAAVLLLAAICERHRETLLQRLRFLAAELEAWE